MISLTHYDSHYEEWLIWRQADHFLVDSDGYVHAVGGGSEDCVVAVDERDPSAAGQSRVIEQHRFETCYEDSPPEALNGVIAEAGPLALSAGLSAQLSLAGDQLLVLNEEGKVMFATEDDVWPWDKPLILRPRHSELAEVVVNPPAERGRLSSLAERASVSA